MSWHARPLVVMGVSGAGKSLIGGLLARTLERPFADADDLHPPANTAKMAAGIPLADEDRWPWLDRVGAVLAAGGPSGSGSGVTVHPPVVMACSALRRSHRDRLRATAPTTLFIHLDGERELLATRLAARTHDFMPPSLLDSQLATLEPLGAEEAGVVVDISPPPIRVVEAIVAALECTAID